MNNYEPIPALKNDFKDWDMTPKHEGGNRLEKTPMTALQQFREDGQKGGITEWVAFRTSDAEMLLSPEWWQAVGKTRAWEAQNIDHATYKYWVYQWTEFIRYLADGSSPEDSLKKI